MARWRESPFHLQKEESVSHHWNLCTTDREQKRKGGASIPKDVVGMLAKASAVSSAEVKGMLHTLGPRRLVVELGGVPDDLEHQLRDSDGVGGRAVAAEAEEGGGPVDRVGDVVLVVRGVEVLAIPASDF